MSKQNDKEINKKVGSILYIGSDASFFDTIKVEFKKMYPSVPAEFKQLESDKPEIIQSYILKIGELKPRLLLIDFSQNTPSMLHLARLWTRQNFYQEIPVIGLCDYGQGKNMVVKAVMTKVPCVHIKSLEYESLIYNMVLLGFNKFLESHGFAMAKLDDAIHCYYTCKVGLINSNFMRIESDYQMQPKQVIRVKNFWSRENILKSDLVMCVDQSQRNIYYNYKYTQALQMAHANPVETRDDTTPEELQLKQEKRQKTIIQSRSYMQKWIEHNARISRPKFLKAFIIDKTGVFYDIKPQTDIYQFTLRIQPFLENTKREIVNHSAHIIMFNMEYIEKETLEANTDIAHTFNDSRMLQHLTKTLAEVFKGSPPLVIVFNSGEYTTDYFKKVFKYPNLLAINNEMSYEQAIKMFKMLAPKITPQLPAPKPEDFYIDKVSDLSYGEIETDINLVACSENDLYFSSSEEISMGTVLRVSLPVPMYITVMPIPEFSKASGYYYGFIHGIGESERKQLRRFINSVFFRGLNKEKVEEVEAHEQRKQEYVEQQKVKELEKQKLIEAQILRNQAEDS